MIDDKEFKFFYYFIFVVIFLVFFIPSRAYAFEVPDNSYYLKVKSNAGNLTIYIPYNQAKYFSTSGNSVVNTNSSSVNTYAQSVSSTYQVRFTYLSTPEYRLETTTGYTSYADLIITEIVDTNLPLLSETDFTLFSQSTIVNMLSLLLIGSVLVFLLVKR